MRVQPYLFFDGRCEEALNFYEKALGAKVTALMRFKDNPDPQMCGPAGSENKVMHANFQVGETQLMASDGQCEGKPTFEGISLTLGVSSPAEAERLFAGLSDGGQVQMPMMETFFAHRWGMVADKFGVSWMVIAEKPH
jgi:PhnB protein